MQRRILEACLIALRIRRRTIYAYRVAVSLGPFGLGRTHRRKTDDRAPHAGARSPLEKVLFGRLEVGQQTNTEKTTRKGGRSRSAARAAIAQRKFTQSH